MTGTGERSCRVSVFALYGPGLGEVLARPLGRRSSTASSRPEGHIGFTSSTMNLLSSEENTCCFAPAVGVASARSATPVEVARNRVFDLRRSS
jgi:hypothetical protein